MSGQAAGGSGDPINDFLYPHAYVASEGEQQAAGSGGVPGPGPSIETSESEARPWMQHRPGQQCDACEGFCTSDAPARSAGLRRNVIRSLLQLVDDVIDGKVSMAAVDAALSGPVDAPFNAAPLGDDPLPDGAHALPHVAPPAPAGTCEALTLDVEAFLGQAAPSSETGQAGLLGRESVVVPEGAGLGAVDAAHEFFKLEAQVHGFTSAIGLDGSIDPAVRRADANKSGLPAARVRVECGLDRGEHLLVVGGYRYAFNELRVHGFLSESDVQILGYAISSLMVAAEQAERVGCKGYALAFFGECPRAMVLQSWAQLMRAVKSEVYGPDSGDSEQWRGLLADLMDRDQWSSDEDGRPYCFMTELGETCSMRIVRLSDAGQVIV